MGRQASSAVTVTDGETVSVLHLQFLRLFTCLSLIQFVICGSYGGFFTSNCYYVYLSL